MRRTMQVVLALLALGGTAQAQQQCNGCGIGYWYQGVPLTGGTMTGPLLLPAGTTANPSLASSANPGSGISFTGVDLYISRSGVLKAGMNGLNWAAASGFDIGFTADTLLTRAAAGIAQLPKLALTAVTFATLGTPANGTIAFCSDCTIANPCAGSGTGSMAKRLNGVWVCN